MQYTYITREKTKLGKKNEERGGPCRQRQSGRPNDAGHVRVAADVTGRSVSLPIGRRRIPPMASVIASSGPEAVNGPDLLLLFRFSLSLFLSLLRRFDCGRSRRRRRRPSCKTLRPGSASGRGNSNAIGRLGHSARATSPVAQIRHQ